MRPTYLSLDLLGVLIFLPALFCLSPKFGQAQNVGVRYLEIGVGAGLMGAGSTGASHVSGPLSLYWNPSGLAEGNRNQATVSYMSWIAGSQVFSLATRLNAGKNAAWGFGVETVSLGDFEVRDEPGESIGSFSADFNLVSLAYARKIGSLNLGITAKYLSERIFEERANGYAIDFGAQAAFLEERLKAGFGVQNLGTVEDFGFNNTELPRIIRAGVHVKVFSVYSQEDREAIVDAFLVTELNLIQNLDITQYHFAAIVEAFESVTASVGYVSNNDASSFSYGLGFAYSEFDFDFAFLPFKQGIGSAAQVVSISYAWK